MDISLYRLGTCYVKVPSVDLGNEYSRASPGQFHNSHIGPLINSNDRSLTDCNGLPAPFRKTASHGEVGPKQYFDGEVLCQPGNDINLAGLVASQSD